MCGDEYRMWSFIADWLRKNSLPIQVLEVKPNRPNVVAVLKGSKLGPRIMLNGHMDAVEPGGSWIHDPFGAEVEQSSISLTPS